MISQANNSNSNTSTPHHDIYVDPFFVPPSPSTAKVIYWITAGDLIELVVAAEDTATQKSIEQYFEAYKNVHENPKVRQSRLIVRKYRVKSLQTATELTQWDGVGSLFAIYEVAIGDNTSQWFNKWDVGFVVTPDNAMTESEFLRQATRSFRLNQYSSYRVKKLEANTMNKWTQQLLRSMSITRSSGKPTMPFTFDVDNVAVESERLAVFEPECLGAYLEQVLLKTHKQCIKQMQAMQFKKPLVQLSSNLNDNLFIMAVHTAYAEHYPLALSPDAIWSLVVQGVCAHMSQPGNAEKYRNVFVNFQGKEKLVVRRDNFILDSSNNDWEGVVREFGTQIEKHIGQEKCQLIDGNFSTTGPVEQIANRVYLMDMMQNYFDYVLRTKCGIPKITLLGTAEDWVELKNKAEKLLSLFGNDLQFWSQNLLPALQQFVDASSFGEVDHNFWRNFYKLEGGSGGPYVSGRINAFFPYLIDTNGKFYQNGSYRMNNVTNYKNAISSAPVLWEYFDQEIPLRFFAGFVGASQDPETGTIKPEIGWAIATVQDSNQVVSNKDMNW